MHVFHTDRFPCSSYEYLAIQQDFSSWIHLAQRCSACQGMVLSAVTRLEDVSRCRGLHRRRGHVVVCGQQILHVRDADASWKGKEGGKEGLFLAAPAAGLAHWLSALPRQMARAAAFSERRCTGSRAARWLIACSDIRGTGGNTCAYANANAACAAREACVFGADAGDQTRRAFAFLRQQRRRQYAAG